MTAKCSGVYRGWEGQCSSWGDQGKYIPFIYVDMGHTYARAHLHTYIRTYSAYVHVPLWTPCTTHSVYIYNICVADGIQTQIQRNAVCAINM